MNEHTSHGEVARLRSMIEALEHSIRMLDESMRAMRDFERNHYSVTPHPSIQEQKIRRDNLTSTHRTLTKRLQSMERTLVSQ